MIDLTNTIFSFEALSIALNYSQYVINQINIQNEALAKQYNTFYGYKEGDPRYLEPAKVVERLGSDNVNAFQHAYGTAYEISTRGLDTAIDLVVLKEVVTLVKEVGELKDSYKDLHNNEIGKSLYLNSSGNLDTVARTLFYDILVNPQTGEFNNNDNQGNPTANSSSTVIVYTGRSDGPDIPCDSRIPNNNTNPAEFLSYLFYSDDYYLPKSSTELNLIYAHALVDSTLRFNSPIPLTAALVSEIIDIFSNSPIGLNIGTPSGDIIIGTDQSETGSQSLTGTNSLLGIGGNDTIYSNGGNDILQGLGGNDELNGGEDNDILNGGSGTNKLYGGNGKDVYIIDTFDRGVNTIKCLIIKKWRWSA